MTWPGTSPVSYYPFVDGPRICIGIHFAMMETMLILATVMSAFRLELAPGQTLKLRASVTLRPQRGMRMILHNRHTTDQMRGVGTRACNAESLKTCLLCFPMNRPDGHRSRTARRSLSAVRIRTRSDLHRGFTLNVTGSMVMTLRSPGIRVLSICLFGLMTCPAHLAAQAVVVTARSATELTDMLETTIKSAALENEPMGQTFMQAVQQFKSGETLKSLDQRRGLGFAFSLPKEFPKGGPPTAVLAVPVSDFGRYMNSLKDLGLTVDDQPGIPGFSHKVTAGNGNPTFFVLQSNGYALWTPIPVQAETLRAIDPTSWRSKGSPDRALSLVLRLPELPEQVKQQFLNSVEAPRQRIANVCRGKRKEPFEVEQAGMELVLKFYDRVVRQGNEIVLDLNMDKKTSQLTIEAAVSALPGTSLETSLRTFNGRRSRFQSLAQDSVAAVWGHFGIENELAEVFMLGFNQQTEAASKKALSANEKKLMTRTAELLRSVLKQTSLDIGATVHLIKKTSGGESRAVILIGFKVPNGKAFDQLLRNTIVVEKPSDKLKLTCDIAKGAGGVHSPHEWQFRHIQCFYVQAIWHTATLSDRSGRFGPAVVRRGRPSGIAGYLDEDVKAFHASVSVTNGRHRPASRHGDFCRPATGGDRADNFPNVS